MKKINLFIALPALSVFLATGCNNQELPVENKTSEENILQQEETTDAVSSENGVSQEDKTTANKETHSIYNQILDQYYTSLNEKWDKGQYIENGLSPMTDFYTNETPLEQLGYAFCDIDFDGTDELMIGSTAPEEKYPVILDLYTIVDGKPLQLSCSDYRNTYHLEYNEEENYIIANEGSSSAACFGYNYYVLESGKLNLIQGVLYDEEANQDNPWFLTTDDDFDSSNDKSDMEGIANDIIDAHSAHYIMPEYTPFSQYK